MDCETFRTSFDREPFAFTHTLNELDLFAFDKLHTLAKKYQRDFYVAGGASAPGTEFYAVPRVEYKPHEAIERLDSGAYRVLLKRPEKYEPRFRELLNALFHQVVELRGGLGSEKIVRLESAILISSADTITPFHFDPEIGFFSQIEGEKTYHVYSPTVVTEAELEPFYLWGEVSIAQVDLAVRDRSREYVFSLGPGKGLHQPQNAPHWVETGKSRSVSFTFVFETDATRARGRVRAFNHYLRKFWLNPAPPGSKPALDDFKAGAMKWVMPVRKRVGGVLRKALGH
jgi:hypothetical protein